MALSQGWTPGSELHGETQMHRTPASAPADVQPDFALLSQVDAILDRLRSSPLIGQSHQSAN